MPTDSETSNEIAVEPTSRHRLVVLYGSQTGVAQAIAERLVYQANHLFQANRANTALSVELLPMNLYTPVSKLKNEQATLLFVCSTTGYGVCPDNMLHFWRRVMHKGLPVGRALPSSLKVAVLGIGDSSYPKFNVVAKKLYRRMIQLGASALPLADEPSPSKLLEENAPDSESSMGLGLADEQNELGVHSLLSWWVPALWNHLADKWRIPFVSDFASERVLWSYVDNPEVIRSTWPKFAIQFLDGAETIGDPKWDRLEELIQTEFEGVFHQDGCLYRIVSNQRVTSDDHFQDSRLIRLTKSVSRSVDGVPTKFSVKYYPINDVHRADSSVWTVIVVCKNAKEHLFSL